MEDHLKVYTFKELEELCKIQDNLIIKEIEKAKDKVIYSWDKGKDGRKFIDKKFIIDYVPLNVSILDNNRGIVIEWRGTIVALDNWGNLVHNFNTNEEKRRRKVNAN